MKTKYTVLFIAICALATTASAASLDKSRLGRRYGGWDDKNGEAAKFRSAGSDYRIYKPDVSRRFGGGLFVSTKLDHIRGMGQDDHADVKLWFDANGRLEKSKMKVEIQRRGRIDTGIIRGAGDASVVAGGDPRIAVAARIAAKTISKLDRQIDRWGEHGGRANFPNVVEHAINRIAGYVR